VIADGTNSTISVTLIDGGGNPVPGKTVTLVRNGNTGSGTPTITPISPTTSAAGVATFGVACTTVGVYDFQATGDGVLITQKASVTFTVNDGTIIPVANGSFEVTNPGDDPWTDGSWMYIPSPWTANMGGYGRTKYSSANLTACPGGGTWIANMTDPGFDVMTQDLHTTVNAGDTLSVTFYVCRDSNGSGVLQASFLVGATAYSQTFDTSTLTVNTWTTLKLAQTIPTGVSGNLSLKFSNVSGRAGWLDNVGNVKVIPAAVPGTYAAWATKNAVGSQTLAQDHDHDGVPNGIEYFLGGNTNTTGFSPLPAVVNTAGTRSVTWTKAAAGYTGGYGSDYVVQTSATLATGSWTDEPASGGGVTLSGNDVRYTFPSGPVTKFVRLKVMGPP